MESLIALEEKVKALVLYAKNLKEQLQLLKAENDLFSSENRELKSENVKLTESNAQLTCQLRSLENSILLESGQVSELQEERLVTRSVLDDLINSIDALVENEN